VQIVVKSILYSLSFIHSLFYVYFMHLITNQNILLLIVLIFCDYEDDGYTMGLTNISSIGLDRPCLGKMDRTTP
jgi:hypothetical protein